MTINAADIAERAFTLINANAPMDSKKLYSKLAVEFIHLTKEEIHQFVEDLIGIKAIVRLNYSSLSGKGSLFFPPETSFEFFGRHGGG